MKTSDDQPTAGAESRADAPECRHCKGTGRHQDTKNPFPRPVNPDGSLPDVAEGWAEGASTRLPVRAEFWVELRPQLLVQETRYLGKEGKKGDDIAGLRELACYLGEWNFAFAAGPAKGQIIPLPDYDPYHPNTTFREKQIAARLATMDFLTTDDLSIAIERLQWLRVEVARQYEVPPQASAGAATTPTPSDSEAV